MARQTMWAAERPRKLQQGTFQETSRGLVIIPEIPSPKPVFGDYRQPLNQPPRFVPQLNKEAAELQMRVIRQSRLVSSAIPSPVLHCTHGSAEPPSSTASTLKAPIGDTIGYPWQRRLESELSRFEASMRRLGHGNRSRRPSLQDPFRTLSSLESGELLHHRLGYNSLKRERERSPQQPAKRPRHCKRYEIISKLPNRDRIFYAGPYLERLEPSQQEQHMHMKLLGTGGEGSAHLLKSRRTGSLVVCKVIPHTRSYKKEESELAFLRDALPPHARIINLRSALVSPFQTQLYLDYCSGGDLSSFIEAYHSHSEPTARGECPSYGFNFIPESFIWHTFLQLTEALAFIHYGYNRIAPLSHQMLGVIHRDIKPGNILLQRAPSHPDHPGPEPYPKIVLADFGLAKKAQNFNVPPTSDNWVGTYIWQPPELPHHSAKGDVWSAGAIIFLMMTGYIPTDGLQKSIGAPSLVGSLWRRALLAEKATCMKGTGMHGYSKGLEWCLNRALALNLDRRISSLQLFCEIEDCRDRVSAGWEEIMPCVWEV
ncbi:MAG: hypothetical protein Q9171_001061 [Xanthocarpia ochracea]